MPEFGRRQYYTAGNPSRAKTSDTMKWKDTTEGPLIFACDNFTDKDPGCMIAEPTGAQCGVLTLEFGRKYLYQADDIRKRSRSLLDSFAEK